MGGDYRRQLQESVNLLKSPLPVRLLRRPVRLIYSKLMERRAIRSGRPVMRSAKTFWGDRMTIAFPETVSVLLYRYGYFEEELTSMIIEYLKPGMTFFDVGTHFGYFTLLASSTVGDRGTVHSFEPTPSTYQVLEANVRDRANVRLFNVAMYSRECEIPFNDFGVAHSAFNSLFSARLSEQERSRLSAKQVIVHAKTIDRHVEETGVSPDFVKIDAESAEFAILQGMERTIAAKKPTITVEVGDVGLDGVVPSKQLVEHLLARGYRAMEYKDGQIREHQLRDRYGYDNILFLPA